MRRAIVVGGGGRRRVVRGLIVPSITYGSAAQSLPKADERLLRTEMARTFGTLAGRSTTVRLLIEGLDPARLVIEKAVMTWVCAVWDNLLERTVMQDAWRVACVDRMSRLGGGKARQGGAAALLDALDRLGWTSPAVDVLKTRDGLLLCFGDSRAVEGGHEADPRSSRKFCETTMSRQRLGSRSCLENLLTSKA